MKELPKRYVTSADVRYQISTAIYDAQHSTFQSIVVIPSTIWNALSDIDKEDSEDYAAKVNVKLEIT